MFTKNEYLKVYDDFEEIVSVACEKNSCSTCSLKRNGKCIKGDVENLFEKLINEHFASESTSIKFCKLNKVDGLLYGDGFFECSNCDELFYIAQGEPKDHDWLFCPHCGAVIVDDKTEIL